MAKNSYRSGLAVAAVVAASLLATTALAGGPLVYFDRFTNIGSIKNTRHNLSQSSLPVPISAIMDVARNDYGEVCVYCHTPHGAQNMKMPLWNRTIKATSYQTYNQLGTTSFSVDAGAAMPPGPASLTCLSCHDGQTAIDSVINMPGAFRKQGGPGAQANQYSGANTPLSGTFLNTWANPAGHTKTVNHQGLNSNTKAGTGTVIGDGTGSQGCMVCHSDPLTGTGALSGAGPDFYLFNLGTDLRNDHPIGVTFPALNGLGTSWHTPFGVKGSSNYFDTNSNGRMEKDEIRTYEGKVECASCHDPHGVPDAGGVFKPTFLRVTNSGSAVCYACHDM